MTTKAIIAFILLMTWAVPASAGRCALITSGVLTRLEVFSGPCPPNLANKPTLKWLPAPIAAKPVFSPVTQIMTGPALVISVTGVTESYSVRLKTAQELDDDKTANVNGISVAVFRALCALKNEIRTKVDSLSAWSDAQCITAFKSLIP